MDNVQNCVNYIASIIPSAQISTSYADTPLDGPVSAID
jgi:hypothetical protein